MALFVAFLEIFGFRCLGKDTCAREVIRRRLLRDVCSFCDSRNVCVSETDALCLQRPAQHLFSLVKRLERASTALNWVKIPYNYSQWVDITVVNKLSPKLSTTHLVRVLVLIFVL